MSRLCLPRYTVIRDTREKEGYGWIFDKHLKEKYPPNCNGTIVKKLDTGDYSLVGYEDILSIERKENFSELWVNLDSSRDRFESEMERIGKLKYAYVLIESTLTSDHFNLSPPQYRRGVPGKALIRWIFSINVKYNVNIIPVGDCGKNIARIIFEEVIRKEKDRWVLSG